MDRGCPGVQAMLAATAALELELVWWRTVRLAPPHTLLPEAPAQVLTLMWKEKDARRKTPGGVSVHSKSWEDFK